MSQQPNIIAASTAAILSPADVWRIIRKRLWMIIACFVVLGLGGTAGLVAWYVWAPFYTAEGIVEVEPGQNQLSALTGGYGGPEVPFQLYPSYVEAQVLAIKNYRVLDAALKELEGRQTLYGGGAAVLDLSQDVHVMYIPNTQNILVSLRGRHREEVTEIVKQILTQYTAQLKEDRDKMDGDRQRDLRTERDDLRSQLTDIGRRLAALRDESSIIVTDERQSEQMSRVTALTQQLTVAQVQLAEAKSAWDQFQKLRQQSEEGKDMAPVLMAFPDVMDNLRKDNNVLAAMQVVSRAAEEAQALKARFGPKNDFVIRSEAALQTAQNDLQAKQSEALGQLFQQQAATLKNKYDRARDSEAELLSRLAEARTAALGAAKLTADYRAREDEFLRTQTLLNTVSEGLEKMRISSVMARPNIRVTRWPMLPLEPSEPRLILYIPAVIIFSLLVGVGLSLLVEIADTRLRTPVEVVRQVGVPLLGSIPDLTEDERLAIDTNVFFVSQTEPRSLLAEAFRQARTNLLFSTDHPIKSVLITSPNPGDGKTTIAVNMALTMARGGNHVLLIEANFRRPSLGRIFDVPDSVGLSNVLVGLATVDDAVQATRIENLDVIVCGILPPSPAELLGSNRMHQLIEELGGRYDQVLIDGAPMLVVADNYLLAEAVDGVVVVYRAGENTKGVAQRTARQIRSLRARLIGAILNRVRATKGGYFREAYQAYYDYSAAACATGTAPAVAPKARPAPSATALADPPEDDKT
jgi:capsular exopolysaccharide synthesis family protein